MNTKTVIKVEVPNLWDLSDLQIVAHGTERILSDSEGETVMFVPPNWSQRDVEIAVRLANHAFKVGVLRGQIQLTDNLKKLLEPS